MKFYEEILDKAQLRAVSEVDREWLTLDCEGLLPMTLTEDNDQLIARYEITALVPLMDVYSWPYERALKVMIDISRLMSLTKRYAFSLAPENIMVDTAERCFIKHRDILPGESFGESRFLAEYKALACSFLEPSVTFRDYMADFTGHFSKKKPVMAKIMNSTCADEIRGCLNEERETYMQQQAREYIQIEEKRYRYQRRYMIFSSVCLLSALMVLAWFCFKEVPCLKAGKELGEYYLLRDYESCAIAMEKIPASKMTPLQSYMLAQAYIHMEDLSNEQRENIIATLNMKDSDMRSKYWVCMGRHDTKQALDLARRLADPELELYSYLQMEKDITDDAWLSGDEKHTMSESVRAEIDKIQNDLTLTEDEWKDRTTDDEGQY